MKNSFSAPAKAKASMFVRVRGSETTDKFLQELNVHDSISVTRGGISMLAKLKQLKNALD